MTSRSPAPRRASRRSPGLGARRVGPLAAVLAIAAGVICAVTLLQPDSSPRVSHGLRPLWNGDGFRIEHGGIYHGGAGRLPPYQWSSAWEEGRGFLAHSDTDPRVMGVTMQPDPTGIRREVIKIRADERQNNGRYTRMELQGPGMFHAGMTVWVIGEILVPRGTPTMPTDRDWWTLTEVYGPPYAGAGPLSIGLARNRRGTGNDLVWRSATGEIRWRHAFREGVWYILARRIHIAAGRAGSVRIFLSHRRASGAPATPLRAQRLADGRFTWHLPTLDASNDGGANHLYLKNYHRADMWPHRRFTDVYFARTRVYAGNVAIRRIDPWYTGLR